jgi:hypothetical protein
MSSATGSGGEEDVISDVVVEGDGEAVRKSAAGLKRKAVDALLSPTAGESKRKRKQREPKAATTAVSSGASNGELPSSYTKQFLEQLVSELETLRAQRQQPTASQSDPPPASTPFKRGKSCAVSASVATAAVAAPTGESTSAGPVAAATPAPQQHSPLTTAKARKDFGKKLQVLAKSVEANLKRLQDLQSLL